MTRRARILAQRWEADASRRLPEEVVVEEPLAIRINGETVATTMRTPGDDFELAVGFCQGEGLLAGVKVRSCRYCSDDGPGRYNVVDVSTEGGRGVLSTTVTARVGLGTSACGWCGSTVVDDLLARFQPLVNPAGVDPLLVGAVTTALGEQQELFATTGGSHAAAAFDQSGALLVVREDVGRHNALDKVVGRLVLDHRVPATGLGLVVSARASFELVQKTWAAGCTTLIAVGAPTSLAVEAAKRANLNLIGFSRPGRHTVYAP